GTAAVAPKPAAAPPPPAADILTVTCGGCQKKMNVRATLAGKAVKCPGCGQPVKVPAPATADEGEEWMEVNEAAAPPPEEAPAPKKGGGASGDWGKELLDEKEVPDEMQDEIRAEMASKERIVWCDRPRADVMLHQAKMFRLIGLPICGTVSLVAFGLTVF